jgi:conjugal transfer/entry exclusion protein
MTQIIGSSNSIQSLAFGGLHQINNQLFRITLLADILSNDAKKLDSIDSRVSQLVEEIRAAAFDVAKSGKSLADMLQRYKPLANCLVSEPLPERLSE